MPRKTHTTRSTRENGKLTMKSPAVINFDEHELANVLVCADCCDPTHVRLMLDYSALNSACYKRQYQKDDAYWLEREELEGAIVHCKPNPERALHTASILHEHLATKHGWPASPRSVPVSSGGVLFTMFDMDKNDIMKEWTDSLRIQIRNRMRQHAT